MVNKLKDNTNYLKPNIIVIGPMKSGTTWLNEYLLQRGDICLPRGVKETFYFDRNYDKNITWYLGHFSHCDANKYEKVIEVGPSYFHSNSSAPRILSELERVKIIIIIREPMSRSISHYNHMKRYGYTKSDFVNAIKEYPEIIDASLYYERIMHWRKYFPMESIYITNMELLIDNEEEFCRGVCKFIGVKYIPPESSNYEYNSAASPRSYWLASISRRLANYLKRKQLYNLVNIIKDVGFKKFIYGKKVKKNEIVKLSRKNELLLASLLLKDLEMMLAISDKNCKGYCEQYLEKLKNTVNANIKL